MPAQKPQMTDDPERVVPFRPRSETQHIPESADAPHDVPPEVQNREKAYRKRQIANLAAALFAVFLAAVGVWLATSLNHMRQVQDCAAMGLRDCSAITNSAPPR